MTKNKKEEIKQSEILELQKMLDTVPTKYPYEFWHKRFNKEDWIKSLRKDKYK